jgi:hypothetical protein
MGSGRFSSRIFLEDKMICGCVGCTSTRGVMTDRCLRDGSWVFTRIEDWIRIPFYESTLDIKLLSSLEIGGWGTA